MANLWEPPREARSTPKPRAFEAPTAAVTPIDLRAPESAQRQPAGSHWPAPVALNAMAGLSIQQPSKTADEVLTMLILDVLEPEVLIPANAKPEVLYSTVLPPAVSILELKDSVGQE